MRRIVLTDDEPIKFFSVLTPDKIEAVYRDIHCGVYLDSPGHCVAMLVLDREGETQIKVERF